MFFMTYDYALIYTNRYEKDDMWQMVRLSN